jgi:hypothetical protein
VKIEDVMSISGKFHDRDSVAPYGRRAIPLGGKPPRFPLRGLNKLRNIVCTDPSVFSALQG